MPSNGQSFYIQNYIQNPNDIYRKLINEITWRSDKIKMFGKVMDQPRKVAWYGDEGIEYAYSGIKMKAVKWSMTLLELKLALEKDLNVDFNSVLINLYRDGNDYMSWHSDDEKELGQKPVIASISLGETRDFLFRLKQDHLKKVKISLENGSLLIMKGHTQSYWHHAIPKRKNVLGPRLNLTFRNILK